MSQVEQNQAVVSEMMAKAKAEKNAALLAQGSKAHIIVDFDFTSDMGTHYQEQVIFRKPSSMDYMKIGGMKSEVLRIHGIKPQFVQAPDGSFVESMAHVDNVILQLATALATCRVLLVNPPAWLQDLDNNEDPNALIALWLQFEVELRSFRRHPATESQGNSETSANETPVASEEALRGGVRTESGSSASTNGSTAG